MFNNRVFRDRWLDSSPDSHASKLSMDRNFAKLVALLATAAVGFSILSTPGDGWHMNVPLLKKLWMGVLLVGTAYGSYLQLRRPPGV